jgi:hypothetical protein
MGLEFLANKPGKSKFEVPGWNLGLYRRPVNYLTRYWRIFFPLPVEFLIVMRIRALRIRRKAV